MPSKKSAEKEVKIIYEYDYRMQKGRRFGIFIALATAYLIASIIMLGVFELTAAFPYFFGTYIVILLAAILMANGTESSVEDYRKRRDKRHEIEKIVKNGERIIGEIVSLDTIEVNGKRQFTYTIEYEGKDKETITLKTPAVVKKRMFIEESDLPLKVVIYRYILKVHVYSIINPPLKRMYLRKAKEYIATIIPFLLFTVAALAAIFKNDSLTVASGLLGALSLIVAWFYYI